ncbi:MAG: AraC family transcriptional regulator [Oscillospiraceae bacterium]
MTAIIGMVEMNSIEHLPDIKKECLNDVQKIDTEKLDVFLRSGNKDNCREVLSSFFEDVGYDRLESLMLRLYIIMDIYICARSYTKELCISNEEFIKRFGSVDDIAVNLATLMSAEDYFSNMLEQCIIWRMEFSRKGSNNMIKKAKEYIAKNYNCYEISLISVADAVNLSPTYFSFIFKKYAGKNFVDYLAQVRLDKAKELLCCSSMQVSEIAYKVGFKDYRYFGQIFKKYTGKTPREFKCCNNVKL